MSLTPCTINLLTDDTMEQFLYINQCLANSGSVNIDKFSQLFEQESIFVIDIRAGRTCEISLNCSTQ